MKKLEKILNLYDMKIVESGEKYTIYSNSDFKILINKDNKILNPQVNKFVNLITLKIPNQVKLLETIKIFESEYIDKYFKEAKRVKFGIIKKDLKELLTPYLIKDITRFKSRYSIKIKLDIYNEKEDFIIKFKENYKTFPFELTIHYKKENLLKRCFKYTTTTTIENCDGYNSETQEQINKLIGATDYEINKLFNRLSL